MSVNLPTHLRKRSALYLYMIITLTPVTYHEGFFSCGTCACDQHKLMHNFIITYIIVDGL